MDRVPVICFPSSRRNPPHLGLVEVMLGKPWSVIKGPLQLVLGATWCRCWKRVLRSLLDICNFLWGTWLFNNHGKHLNFDSKIYRSHLFSYCFSKINTFRFCLDCGRLLTWAPRYVRASPVPAKPWVETDNHNSKTTTLLSTYLPSCQVLLCWDFSMDDIISFKRRWHRMKRTCYLRHRIIQDLT